ncbi:MAG: ERF superfamily [Candidatus Pacebacteria bacterium GW2011_GWF1_36_5]|nr:MAG: ERF superfamily [Candidatus Pacebacteria bacterium GW2011_GWF1_36_5]
MNIYQKLIEVRKVAPYLKKENKSFQYSYVSSSQVLIALKEKMDDLGLLLIPSVESARYADILHGKNSKGNETVEILTELDMTFTWVNADNPEEKISVKWYGQGIDTTGEKGVGKALTYAEKYFMLKFFNIPTDKDDPDSKQLNPNGEKTESRFQQPNKPDIKPVSGKDNIEYFNDSNIKNFKTLVSKHPEIEQQVKKEFGVTSTKEFKKSDFAKVMNRVNELKKEIA